MKRSLLAAVALAAVTVGSYMVWAEQQGNQQRMNMMRQRMMAEQGGPMGAQGACPMCMGMMGHMMQKSMVALNDGGVAVLVGNQLMLFDDDLELEERTELPIDMEQMQQQMMRMMQNCPMCRQRMQEMQPGGMNMGGMGPGNEGPRSPAGE